MIDRDGNTKERYWFITEYLEENKWTIHEIIHLKQTIVLKCITSKTLSPTYYIDTTG